MAIVWDQDEFMRAYLFAAQAHKNQWLTRTTDLPSYHPSEFGQYGGPCSSPVGTGD